jgi:hypothetical protein
MVFSMSRLELGGNRRSWRKKACITRKRADEGKEKRRKSVVEVTGAALGGGYFTGVTSGLAQSRLPVRRRRRVINKEGHSYCKGRNCVCRWRDEGTGWVVGGERGIYCK